MVLNHGKEKPSNMVAEGSFDPNTGFHLSRSAKDSDHGLECMASSHPMSKKEATDFLMDVIVAEKRGGNDEKIHATYRSGGNKTSGDVHHAYAARPAWKYNGIPGSQREIKPRPRYSVERPWTNKPKCTKWMSTPNYLRREEEC